MRMRSPSIDPPENGLDGSIATIATRRPLLRIDAASLATSVDLPLPGTPVMPTTCARPAWRKIWSSASRDSRAPDSARVSSRAIERRSPLSAPATSSVDGMYAIRNEQLACAALGDYFSNHRDDRVGRRVLQHDLLD